MGKPGQSRARASVHPGGSRCERHSRPWNGGRRGRPLNVTDGREFTECLVSRPAKALGKRISSLARQGAVQGNRQFFSMPTAPSTLLSAVRTFRARWLNREVSQVPSFDFRRSTGFLRGKFRSVRTENGQERWIRAISAWTGASLRLGARTFYIGAWDTVGERLHREYQREIEGRAAGQGLLYAAGGACADGAVQADLQPGQAAQLAGLPLPPAPEALMPADPVPVLAGRT